MKKFLVFSKDPGETADQLSDNCLRETAKMASSIFAKALVSYMHPDNHELTFHRKQWQVADSDLPVEWVKWASEDLAHILWLRLFINSVIGRLVYRIGPEDLHSLANFANEDLESVFYLTQLKADKEPVAPPEELLLNPEEMFEVFVKEDPAATWSKAMVPYWYDDFKEYLDNYVKNNPATPSVSSGS